MLPTPRIHPTKRTKKLALLAMLFTLSEISQAEEDGQHFCASAFQIEPHIQSCENNDLLVKYGDNCMIRLNSEVDTVVKALNANLKTGIAMQKGDFAHAMANGMLSVAQLDRLIWLTELASRDMKPYLDVILIPEDIDVPEITGPNPKAWAESIPCYGRTKNSIEFLQNMLAQRLQEFKAARQAAVVIQNNSGAREVKVSSQSLTKQALKGQGQGSAKRKPAGKFDPNHSDVTGGDIDAKKRREGQKILNTK